MLGDSLMPRLVPDGEEYGPRLHARIPAYPLFLFEQKHHARRAEAGGPRGELRCTPSRCTLTTDLYVG